MKPLQENAPTKRPTMRLRDPFSSYKCFEAIATPSPITPITDNQNSNNNNMHRATSLDSLANSSEQDSSSDGGGGGGGVSGCVVADDTTDDIDKISDVDSITTYSQVNKRKITNPNNNNQEYQHRKSDLEGLKCEPIPKEPVIKAYLEKSHRKCDYKKCEYKKSDSSEKIKSAKDGESVNKLGTNATTTNNNNSNNVNNNSNNNCVNGGSNSNCSTASSSSSKTRKTSITSSGSVGRMETIVEEPNEPKVSVKEILARFETMHSLEVGLKFCFFSCARLFFELKILLVDSQ